MFVCVRVWAGVQMQNRDANLLIAQCREGQRRGARNLSKAFQGGCVGGMYRSRPISARLPTGSCGLEHVLPLRRPGELKG